MYSNSRYRSTILTDPPTPLVSIGHTVQSLSANDVLVRIDWSPPTDNGGNNIQHYHVSVLSSSVVSTTVVSGTSITITANYSVPYTVEVVASNCAGNSTPSEITFQIGNLQNELCCSCV